MVHFLHMVKIKIIDDVAFPNAPGFPAGSVQVVAEDFAAVLVERGHAEMVEESEIEKPKPKNRK